MSHRPKDEEEGTVGRTAIPRSRLGEQIGYEPVVEEQDEKKKKLAGVRAAIRSARKGKAVRG